MTFPSIRQPALWIKIALPLILLCLAFPLASLPARTSPGRRFFGIAPQTALTPEDVSYMKAGGIESVRWPLLWSLIQPTAKGGYDWSAFDQAVGTAARAGLRILPSVGSTPPWLAGRETVLPVRNARQTAAWTAFMEAAVKRYGPQGEFWKEARQGIGSELPVARPLPIREWQIWNEPNFFYFADPISPSRYGRLLKISSRAIKAINPHARVILSGLFGRPKEPRRKGLPASTFLARLYRIGGLKRYFDGIALHPYAAHVGELKALVKRMRRVAVRNGDRRVPLYITEMGWGSQNDSHIVAFEQGPHGQARELRRAYRFLLRVRQRLRVRAVYWFSWKDLAGSCSFCDSAGLFQAGSGFEPKPAWRTFVGITGGRLRP